MILRIFLLSMFLTFGVLQQAWAEKINLALMPIDMEAAGKYQYLGGALNSMLAGRLTSDGNVAIIDSAITRAELQQLAGDAGQEGSLFTRLGVDFVGSGFCYETADGMKLQMNFFSSEQGEEPVTVTMTTQGEAAILSELDTFSAEIKSRVFGFEQYTLSGAASGDDALGAFQTSHPEKAYKMGAYTTASDAGEGGGSLITMGIRTAITLDNGIINMASGDLNGDGVNEHVLLSRSGLVVVVVSENRLRVVSEYNFGNGYKANRVYVADMDGDGSAEIFVSGDVRFAASSQILSWDLVNGVSVLEERINWYIRPVEFKGRKPVLIGQRSSRSLDNGFLARGIYELEKNQDSQRFIGWKRFVLPERVNIFDFTLADLNGDKLPETVVVDKNEKLNVYSPSGELLFVSEDNYGGSLVHFGPTTAEIQTQTNIIGGNISKEQAEDRILIYIPEPAVAKDVTGDGRDEIIISKNLFQGMRILANSRSYSGGSVVCLKWDNDELKEVWKTKRYPGYLSGYSLWLSDAGSTGETESTGQIARMVLSYAGKSSFLGISIADKTKVETFSFEIK